MESARVRPAIVLCAALLSAPIARAQTTIEDLGIPGGAACINEAGRVAGYWWTGTGSRAFRYTDGVGLELLPPIPNHQYTEYMSINARGDVLISATLQGTQQLRAPYLYTDAGGMTLITAFITTDRMVQGLNDAGQLISNPYQNTSRNHASRYTPGMGVRDLGTLLGVNGESNPFAINNLGQVAGISQSHSPPDRHAFRYSDGEGMIDLGTLGLQSLATAMNDHGDVVGWCAPVGGDDNRYIGFLYTDQGGMEPLGFLPNTPGTMPAAINDRGWIVGTTDPYNVLGEPYPAFIWMRETSIQDLNALLPADSGWHLRFATGINHAGQVVGAGVHNGQQRLFRMNLRGIFCPADFNADGAVNSDDFFAYLAAFFSEGPGSDFNGDRVVNTQDLFDYLTAFFGGC